MVQKVIKEELLDYMKAIKPRKNSFAQLLMDTKDPKTGTLPSFPETYIRALPLSPSFFHHRVFPSVFVTFSCLFYLA